MKKRMYIHCRAWTSNMKKLRISNLIDRKTTAHNIWVDSFFHNTPLFSFIYRRAPKLWFQHIMNTSTYNLLRESKILHGLHALKLYRLTCDSDQWNDFYLKRAFFFFFFLFRFPSSPAFLLFPFRFSIWCA